MVQTYNRKDRSKQLSKNFILGEFACKCGKCSNVLVDDTLVKRLQQIRDHFGKALVITSAYRCSTHNKNVGGASGSRHVKGQAADFYISGVAPAEIAKYAESIGVKGIGLYEKADCGSDFVHIDTRTQKSFWYGHKQVYRSTFGGAPVQSFTVKMTMLQKGMSGDKVKALQALLIGYGYDIQRDGIFGPATEKAVKDWQSKHGLSSDGIVGPATMNSLMGL